MLVDNNHNISYDISSEFCIYKQSKVLTIYHHEYMHIKHCFKRKQNYQRQNLNLDFRNICNALIIASAYIMVKVLSGILIVAYI